MVIVASRELRNHTSALLERVRLGEQVGISVRGDVVAELRPVTLFKRPTLNRNALVRLYEGPLPDPGLSALLDELSSDTTDDL
jgi:prevent-host-death family protein